MTLDFLSYPMPFDLHEDDGAGFRDGDGSGSGMPGNCGYQDGVGWGAHFDYYEAAGGTGDGPGDCPGRGVDNGDGLGNGRGVSGWGYSTGSGWGGGGTSGGGGLGDGGAACGYLNGRGEGDGRDIG